MGMTGVELGWGGNKCSGMGWGLGKSNVGMW